MRIVNVNKFYYLRGGAERYFFSLADLLKQHGYDVVPFSMAHPQNLRTPYAKYFPSYVEFGTSPPPLLSRRGSIRVLRRMFWSRETARKFDQLLSDTKPDLVHIHNIYHQLSPSLLPVAKRHGIPVVMTVHDYKLIWPDYLLCGYHRGASYWNVVRERCTQGSYAKSLLVVLEKKFHDWLRVYEKNINLFLAPSAYVRAMLVEGGIPEAKIRVLPHFVAMPPYKGAPCSYKGHPCILYFGRLSKEKGLDVLLAMMHDMKSGTELRIAGAGPEIQRLRVTGSQLPVTFLGQLDEQGLAKEIDRAAVIVAPSIVPETFGYTILEAFARGKPVVASRIGAFPELIEEGKTGLLAVPGDARDLLKKVERLLNDHALASRMGKNALAVARGFSSEKHYERLMHFYHALL